MDNQTLPANNVVPIRPHGLISAADDRTLQALAQYEGREGDEARAKLAERGREIPEITMNMSGLADRIWCLLEGGPDAAALTFDYATGQERR